MLWLQSSISTVAQELWYSHWWTIRSGIIDLDGNFRAVAAHGVEERFADVEVQRVAEFVGARSAAGFDAGGEIARVVAAETALAERAEQILAAF